MNRLLISISLLIFLSTSCHVHDPSDGQLHGADDQIPDVHASQEFTVYSDRLELFIEIDELKAGEESGMHAHFTTLKEVYGPLENARISMQAKLGSEIINQVDANPSIPGIYELKFTPEKQGVLDLYFLINAPGLNDTVVLHHVHVAGKEPGHHHHEEAELGEITFTKEQAWKSRFRVEQVQQKSFNNVITASGEMTAMPGEKQNISARTEGLILFTSRDLVQGSKVTKGDLLFTISGRGMADNNVAVKFNDAKTQYLLSKSNFERQKKLYEQQVVSERQFIEARSRYVSDSVMYYSLNETVTSEGLNMYAPKSGHLHELNVSEGQYVERGQLLATLSNDQVILLRADVPQQHYAGLKLVIDANFRPAYSDRVYTIEELDGRLLARGASVAENDHYLPLYFEVNNDGSLLEGAFVEFYLKTTDMKQAIVIPSSTLIEEQNNFYVYVQVSGETYAKRQVSIIANDGITSAISGGVEAGERIVTEGVMLVKTASINAVPTHGHAH